MTSYLYNCSVIILKYNMAVYLFTLQLAIGKYIAERVLNGDLSLKLRGSNALFHVLYV